MIEGILSPSTIARTHPTTYPRDDKTLHAHMDIGARQRFSIVKRHGPGRRTRARADVYIAHRGSVGFFFFLVGP